MTTAQVLNADQLNAIAKQSGYTGGTFSSVGLSQAQPTSVVSEVNPVASPKLPTIQQPTGNISNAVSSTSGVTAQMEAMQKYFTDQANLAKEQLDALQKEQSNARQSILSIFNSTPSQRNQAFSSIGIDPSQYFADQKAKIAEIETLNQEYNAIKQAAEQQKASLIGQGRGITQDFLNNQAAQIDRNSAPKLNALSANINSKAATLQALQNNFNEARSFVNQAVEDATYDTRFKLETIKTFYDMNQDTISRLDTKYQNALQTSISLAQQAYEQDQAQKRATGDAMIKYNSIGAGININDNPDIVAQKISSVGGDLAYYRAQQKAQFEFTKAGQGGDVTSDSDVETYAQAILDGTLEETNVPEKYRAGAIRRANEIAKQALEQETPQQNTPQNTNSVGVKDVLRGAATKTYETVNSFIANLFGY